MGELQKTFISVWRVYKLNVEFLRLFIAEVRNSTVDGFPVVPCPNLPARMPHVVLTNYFMGTILEKFADNHVLKTCPLSVEPNVSLHSTREIDTDPYHEQVEWTILY